MSLATLAEIGLKTLQLQEAIDARKTVAARFGKACANWKHQHGHGFIAKDSAAWGLMMDGVDREYSAVQQAKRTEYNARRRLERACRKAQHELAAGAAAERFVRRAMESAS